MKPGDSTGKQIRILWTDDEIEVLKPHILFLTARGYLIDTCTNGTDAVDMVKANVYDLAFLDENMPGLSGIETLGLIRQAKPDLPVIMITHSEEEKIMEAAIGSEIADYLIKPVKPNQILLAIKKNTQQRRLITEKTTNDYRTAFGSLTTLITMAGTADEWFEVFRKLVFWQTELRKSTDPGMNEILESQISEANNGFTKFIASKYGNWFGSAESSKPLLSPAIMEKKVFPLIEAGRPLFFIVIDNLRYDQWKTIAPVLSDYYRVASEELYMSILPTATQYSRNAIFSGMLPVTIRETMPTLWVDDDEEEGKNQHEEKLLEQNITRHRLKIKWAYEKLLTNADSRRFNDRYRSLMNHDLVTLVYNSVDTLSHARTDAEVMKELAADEEAFCSLTLSWFTHSPLFELLKMLSQTNVRVIITTDHGNIRVRNPIKIVGDRATSSNLRYKLGRNLAYNPKDVFEVTNPRATGLPAPNISSRFIFATGTDYLVYQNNYNHFATYFKDTFQHGGVSLYEMLCPLITLEPVR
jgi:CheY-like chemotaxis protein